MLTQIWYPNSVKAHETALFLVACFFSQKCCINSIPYQVLKIDHWWLMEIVASWNLNNSFMISVRLYFAKVIFGVCLTLTNMSKNYYLEGKLCVVCVLMTSTSFLAAIPALCFLYFVLAHLLVIFPAIASNYETDTDISVEARKVV